MTNTARSASRTSLLALAGLALAAIVVLALARANAPEPADPQGPVAVATRPLPPRAAGAVVARVEEQPIYESELREAVALLVALSQTGELVRIDDTSGAERRVDSDAERALCEDLLVRFLYDELARQEAAARRVVVDDAAIDRAIATTEAAYEDPSAVATTEAFLLEHTGLPQEEFERQQRNQHRSDLLRRSVNTILREELDTEERAVVDAWWEERWAAARIEWDPQVCAGLYP
jgi:hypothetical protein